MSYWSSSSDSDESIEVKYPVFNHSVAVYLINSGAKPGNQHDGIFFSRNEDINYRTLIKKVKDRYPVLKNEDFYMTLIDELGSAQTIYNDHNLSATERLSCRNQLYIVYNYNIDESTGESYPSQYFCNYCCSTIKYAYYKCIQCPQYELCENCKYNGVHSSHDLELLGILSHKRNCVQEINKFHDYDLKYREKIGEGYFGKVYTAKSISLDRRVAVKLFKDPCGKANNFYKELRVLEQLGVHENVVRIFGYVDGHDMGIIMEHVTMNINGREISGLSTYFMRLRYLLKRKRYVNHRELDSFALQIARGMEHLVKKNILHRDLAIRNILIDDKKIVKVSDFGTSRLGDIYDANHMFAVRWAAPEVLKHNQYSHDSDVWAFGIVLWEIATLGAMPYGDLSNSKIRRLVLNGQHLIRPKNVANRLYRIMERCWAMSPQNRPTFNALVEKLIDFKWMEPGFYGFDSVSWGEDLPDAVEIYQQRYEESYY